MSVWCKDLTNESKKPIYATYSAHFRRFYKMGRDILIQLVKEAGITNNPYILPTCILADRLVKASIISRESLE